jgi:hypothetical protein
MQTLSETPRDASRDGRSVTRAWISLAVLPLFLVLAMAVGEGLYALFGYQPENADAPFGVNLVASVPALLVMLVPTVAAVFYGWRAHLVGDRRAYVPAILALLIGLWFTVLTVIGLAVGPV